MYNLAVSTAVSLVVFAVIAPFFGAVPAVAPAILVGPIVYVLVARRISKQVTEALAPLATLLQQGDVAGANALIETVRTRWARWQLLLAGSLDAQRGMIVYMQRKFDDALPLLEKGTFGNWAAWVCIGAVHFRRKRLDKAWSAFKSATSLLSRGKQEAMVYVVWAVCAIRSGDRDRALSVVADGIKAIPDSQVLKDLQGRIANDKKVEAKHLPETFYQFFPEELAARMLARGRREGPPAGAVMRQAPFPQPKASRRDRRGR